MTYVQKARLTFLGIDDELKNDATSVYTTNINYSFFPVPTTITAATAPIYEDQQYGVEELACAAVIRGWCECGLLWGVEPHCIPNGEQ